MIYLFPETIFSKMATLDQQWESVCSEFVEANREEQPGARAVEAVDIIQALETWLRIYERKYGVSVVLTQDQVVVKNERRGYYFAGAARAWFARRLGV